MAAATLKPTAKVPTSHKACIHHIAHDYYGKRVATCSSDKVRPACAAAWCAVRASVR